MVDFRDGMMDEDQLGLEEVVVVGVVAVVWMCAPSSPDM